MKLYSRIATCVLCCIALLCVPVVSHAGNSMLSEKNYRIPDNALALTPRQTAVVDYSTDMPPVGAQNLDGAGVAWAAAYYKSYQERKEHGWGIGSNPSQAVSPYFLFNNGGGFSFPFSGELLTNYGAPLTSSFGTYDVDTTDGTLLEAASYKASGYKPLFLNQTSSLGKYKNNLDTLKNWLANGDLFVLIVPVYTDFETYTSGVYNHQLVKTVSSKDNKPNSYQAICVVGYDDTLNAFHAINSWGTDWGNSGYCWLDYTFVQTFALESWVLYDLKPFDPTALVYTYTGDGTVAVDSTGLTVTNGGSNDTLKITGAAFDTPIPLVKTDKSFKTIYTTRGIDKLDVSNYIGTLTTKGCYIPSISATRFDTIKMQAPPDSGWYNIAKKVYDDMELDLSAPRNMGTVYYTNISTTYTKTSSSVVNLTGIVLQSLEGPKLSASITLASKKAKKSWGAYCYSKSGVCGPDSNDPATGAYIDVYKLPKLYVTGDGIYAESITADDIGSIYAKYKTYTYSFCAPIWKNVTKTHWEIVPGNIEVEDINSRLYLNYVVARGGDILVPLLVSHRGIGTIYASYIAITPAWPSDLVVYGGHVGEKRDPDYMAVISGALDADESEPDEADIDYVYGSLGIAGRFSAGARAKELDDLPDPDDDDYENVVAQDPVRDIYYDGKGWYDIVTLVTRSECSNKIQQNDPVISGEGWTYNAIDFVGGTHGNFDVH
jgi:cathepsin K